MAFDLDAGIEGKSVLLTGGAGGIGREIALAFDAAGARVAVVDLAQDAVDATVAAMAKARHLGIACDLKPVAGHAALVGQVADAFGGVDILVQTAAVLVRRPSVLDVSEADWDIQHDVNLKASFFLAQTVARRMCEAAQCELGRYQRLDLRPRACQWP